jgi:membrane protein DedA with SNARE-associated domain
MEHVLIGLRDWLTAFDGLTIYGVCFGVLLLCGFGLPVPEDITLLICGYLTYRPMPDGTARPHVHIIASLLIGLAGVLIGDSTMFWLGGKFGERLRGVRPFSYILGHGRLEHTEEFLQSHGPKVLFSARFTPGLRSVVFFSSGVLKIPFKTFLFYDGMAALLSVPALILSAWHWGPDFEDVLLKARKAENGMLFVILGVAALLIGRWLYKRRKKAKGDAL